jgi:hypothetical protein
MTAQSMILSDALEERMAHVPLGRLCPIFDFGQHGRFDPDAAMRDFLGVRRAASSGSAVSGSTSFRHRESADARVPDILRVFCRVKPIAWLRSGLQHEVVQLG